MANKYCNLVGSNLIKDEFGKINTGFDKVESDIMLANNKADLGILSTGDSIDKNAMYNIGELEYLNVARADLISAGPYLVLVTDAGPDTRLYGLIKISGYHNTRNTPIEILINVSYTANGGNTAAHSWCLLRGVTNDANLSVNICREQDLIKIEFQLLSDKGYGRLGGTYWRVDYSRYHRTERYSHTPKENWSIVSRASALPGDNKVSLPNIVV